MMMEMIDDVSSIDALVMKGGRSDAPQMPVQQFD